MEISDDVKELVLNRESTHLIKSKAREKGMVTLRETAIRKLLTGVTTVEEVMRVTFADVE
jgi:type IV pilus assembly protein PilB